MRILIAEDDALARRVLTTLLEALGHEVVATPDGREAWGAFERGSFAVVISDWMMPGLDGLELCRRIRGADRTRYTYLILLSSLGGKSHFLEGMEAGADDFLTKPPDPDELRLRLRVAERVLGLQAEVRQLEGLLPICSYCKRIRDEHAGWTRVESYIASRTDATFTHGICPDCKETYVKPELDRLKGVPAAPPSTSDRRPAADRQDRKA
jgi:phosphoserine phosphatase RsbU/P